MAAGERGLKARSEDEQAVHERELRELRAKVGELVLELAARKTGSPDGKPEKARELDHKALEELGRSRLHAAQEFQPPPTACCVRRHPNLREGPPGPSTFATRC